MRSVHTERDPSELIFDYVSPLRFQTILEAYETLSDAQERAWYDAHRDQILRGDEPNSDEWSAGVDLGRSSYEWPTHLVPRTKCDSSDASRV